MILASSDRALLPSLAIILSAFFWGSMWMPMHALSGTGLSGSWAAWLIYGVPVVLTLPLALRKGTASVMAGGWPLLWLGVSTGICNYLYAVGVVYGDVARIVLLFYVNPVWSVLLERLILGTRISRGRAAALVLGIGGMWILNYDGEGLPLPRSTAEWCGLAAGFFWAVGLVCMRLTPHLGMVEKAFSQYVAALLFGALILALGIFPPQADWSAVAWGPAIFWIAVVAGVWVLPSLLLSFWGAGRLSPTRASMLFMVEVVVGVVTAAIWTDYPFGLREAAGGLVIISAGLVEILFHQVPTDRTPHGQKPGKQASTA
jgi:drug/metabolite transporter (DMT)-like permease